MVVQTVVQLAAALVVPLAILVVTATVVQSVEKTARI